MLSLLDCSTWYTSDQGINVYVQVEAIAAGLELACQRRLVAKPDLPQDVDLLVIASRHAAAHAFRAPDRQASSAAASRSGAWPR